MSHWSLADFKVFITSQTLPHAIRFVPGFFCCCCWVLRSLICVAVSISVFYGSDILLQV
jgi:hypothetical protein